MSTSSTYLLTIVFFYVTIVLSHSSNLMGTKIHFCFWQKFVHNVIFFKKQFLLKIIEAKWFLKKIQSILELLLFSRGNDCIVICLIYHIYLFQDNMVSRS